MTLGSQRRALGRKDILGKLSFRGKAGPPNCKHCPGPSPQALFGYPVFSPLPWGCERSEAWKQNHCSYEQEPRRKGMAGPRLLSNWMSRYVCCRCLAAALSYCEKKRKRKKKEKKTAGPSSEQIWDYAWFSTSIPGVLSFPATRGRTAESRPALLRICSPGRDHCQGQLQGSTEVAESCACFCRRAGFLSKHPHAPRVCTRTRTREACSSRPVPSQSRKQLPEGSPRQPLRHGELPELHTELAGVVMGNPDALPLGSRH